MASLFLLSVGCWWLWYEYKGQNSLAGLAVVVKSLGVGEGE